VLSPPALFSPAFRPMVVSLRTHLLAKTLHLEQPAAQALHCLTTQAGRVPQACGYSLGASPKPSASRVNQPARSLPSWFSTPSSTPVDL
jgi:hypothetical protein